jgi:regulatory protein
MWMRSLIAVGKWEREIKIKLQKKEFPKSLIEEYVIQSQEEVRDWESNRHAVEHQIFTLESRGKSKQVISQLLVSRYPYFRDEIAEILNASSDTSALRKEIEKYSTRYNLEDPKEKQKFYAAILRKGFRFDDIKRELIKDK